jgi:NodT family efflux transporter outer membrane factor (OMF) lipoprotein
MMAAVVCCLTACKLGPNFKEPDAPVPDHYAGASTPETPGVPHATDAAPQSFWWQEFHDAELDHLEERAGAGNLDLQAAYLRIVEARVQVQAARAQGLPSLKAQASYNRDQLGAAGILKSQHVDTGAGTSPTTQSLINSIETPVNIYQLGFDASWELDLFGRVRRSVELADAKSVSAVESRNDMLVSLQAEVAQTYLQLRANQFLRKITVDLIAAQQEVTDLTRNQHQHGLASEADVAAAEAQLESLKAELPPFDQSTIASRHALAVLIGLEPAALDEELGAAGELPDLPAAIPIGLPSTLARRRPDIRQSEAALHAATAQVGVSVASMYPDISLSGTLGLRNLSPGYLFDWDSKFYTVGPSISVPIFQGGALVANVRLSRAQAAEATLNYRKTVLGALQEVEDGLTNLQQDGLRTAALRDTVTAEQRAVDFNLDSYTHGLTTYVAVLTVQIQLVKAKQEFAQALLTQSIDLVKLYKAVGGGWQDAPSTASR